jgi:small subunit ribosomal protein S10
MKFRILLRSFDNELINIACEELRSTLLRTECELNGVVSLPTKIKRFCVLRSPHIDKDSREHFEVRVHKRVLEIHYDSEVPIFDLLTEIDLAPGVFYRICLS